jgi:hypothetical protein
VLVPETGTAVTVDFTNTNPSGCPTSYRLDQDNTGQGTEIEASMKTWLTINAANKIQIQESVYPGGDFNLWVRAITDFGTPLFKAITITEKCGRQTHQVLSNFNF